MGVVGARPRMVRASGPPSQAADHRPAMRRMTELDRLSLDSVALSQEVHEDVGLMHAVPDDNRVPRGSRRGQSPDA